jgi:predicted peroxiredoxin
VELLRGHRRRRGERHPGRRRRRVPRARRGPRHRPLFLTVEGVRIATKGYAESIHKEGFKPLKEVLDSFIENGGTIWACAACTTPRGITTDDMIDGATIVTAANLVEYLASGAVTY